MVIELWNMIEDKVRNPRPTKGDFLPRHSRGCDVRCSVLAWENGSCANVRECLKYVLWSGRCQASPKLHQTLALGFGGCVPKTVKIHKTSVIYEKSTIEFLESSSALDIVGFGYSDRSPWTVVEAYIKASLHVKPASFQVF
jgi:hypothetical protein